MSKKASKKHVKRKPPKAKPPKASSGAGRVLFYIWQLTWGLPVNLIGAVAFLIMYKGHRHERFCNAFITYVPGNWGGVSLGLFIFMADGRDAEWEYNTRIHEYGHTIQCLLLGVFYWFFIGIPSAVWCNLPACVKYRKEKDVSYYSFYPERWANLWGSEWSRLTMTRKK